MRNMSLRIRLTFLTGIILTAVCICLTIISVLNANRTFVVPFNGSPTTVVQPPTQSKIVKPIQGDISNNQGKNDVYLVFMKSQQQFTYTSILYMVVFIVVGTGLTYVISGRALKPVTDLSKAVEDIDESNLSARIASSNTHDEVERLTASFNNMLGKLDRAFENQKLFAQSAAHELRTPLSSIMANIEVLQMDANPSVEEYQETIDVVQESTERLILLVSDLLKLNADINPDRCAEFSSEDMMDSIIHELEPYIREKHIVVEQRCKMLLYGEKELTYRAFFNLMMNAIKYNRDGGKIAIFQEGRKIFIEDTGIGIPCNKLGNIFDPFFCVDPSRSRKQGGSGLGLTIVKNIIEKHGWNISIQSEINKGTTVMIELPA